MPWPFAAVTGAGCAPSRTWAIARAPSRTPGRVHGLDRVDHHAAAAAPADRREHALERASRPAATARTRRPRGARARGATCSALSRRSRRARARARRARAAWSSSVVLPMPGSPPISTTDPGTRPPPSTRSSSPMPVATRRPTCGSISPMRVGADDAGPITATSAGTATSSTSVFHCPHDEHCPAHFGCDAPQLLQTCSIFALAMWPSLTEGCHSAADGRCIRSRAPGRPTSGRRGDRW